MADIGRLRIAQALKNAFDLTGKYGPALGEGIVPTVELLNLELTPFTVSTPFVRRIARAALALEFSHIQLRTLLTNGMWVTIDKLVIANATSVHIEPFNRSALPSPLNTPVISRAVGATQADLARVRVADVEITSGTDLTGALGDSTLILGPTVLTGPWHFGPTGALVVISELVNQALDISFFGRVHYVASPAR